MLRGVLDPGPGIPTYVYCEELYSMMRVLSEHEAKCPNRHITGLKSVNNRSMGSPKFSYVDLTKSTCANTNFHPS
jgi:hypothetical protein